VNGTDDMRNLEEFCRIDQDFIEVASDSKIKNSEEEKTLIRLVVRNTCSRRDFRNTL